MKFHTRDSIYGPIRVAQFSNSEDKLLSLKQSKEIAQEVRSARLKLSISLTALARELNMKASELKRFESGKVRCRQMFWPAVNHAITRIRTAKLFKTAKPLTKTPK